MTTCKRLTNSLPKLSLITLVPFVRTGVSLSDAGRACTQVDNTFEVKGAGGGGKVFALGDCADIPVPKMAYLAGGQGLVVAKQVAASAAGKPLKGAIPKPQAVSLVPVGKSGGVSLLPMGIVAGDFLTRNIKSRDLFASKFWGEMNAGKAPPIP